MTVTVEIPIRTRAETNRREHYFATARVVRKQRDDVALALSDGWRGRKPKLPAKVTLTRIAPGELDDDAVQHSLKAVRDQVAVAIGLPIRKLARGQGVPVADDRDPRVTWAYGQERRGRDYAVRVEVEEV